MPLSPGLNLGQYEVLDAIGAGGMGEVYRARDSRLDRVVALKALAAGVEADEERLARLRREARVVAQLNHPHIAQIHQLLEHESGTYLVLEYVPGTTLAERIRSRTGLGVDESLRFGVQLARALEAAHARGVIHRDLKPGNVMVTPDGTLKVLDFGLSVRFSDEDHGRTATQTPTSRRGGILGTPGYMAPEQVRGEDVDVRADIWSFGCVLYECLTGGPVLRGGSSAELLAATLTAEPNWGRLPEGLPEPVRALLRRCLARDLGQRQQSIGDARLILQEALGVAPLTPEAPAVVAAVPNNLPHEASHFIGRGAQLDELAALLGDNVLLTLTGAGGSGKTRLATELGRRVLDRFPGGVWLAELAPIADPARVGAVVAAAVEAKEEGDRPPVEAIAQRLANARALLILDNCEHVLESAIDLTQALVRAVPGLRIVATSREALGVAGERSYRVPSLGLPPAFGALGEAGRPDASDPRARASVGRATPAAQTPSGSAIGGTPATPAASSLDLAAVLASESVALFVDRARGVKPAFEVNDANAPAVVAICRRLDGIPLAIELAAARVKMLSPEQILAKLDDRFRLLTSGGRGVMERQRTLRAAVDWSYKLLSPSERRMLRMLSVFAGGWTLEAAVAVCGPGGGPDGGDLDEFEVLDVLTHLVDKSLVQVDDRGEEPRYRLLETVRQYASEELDRDGETVEARDRHLHYWDDVVSVGTGAGQRYHLPLTWIRRHAPEVENLLEAMTWARVAPAWEGGGDSRVTRAARIGERLLPYWITLGLRQAPLLAVEGLLERETEMAPETLPMALYVAAVLDMRRGEFKSARARLERAHRISRERSLPLQTWRCLTGLGNLEYLSGNLEASRSLREEALTLARTLNDPDRTAGSLLNLSGTIEGDSARTRAVLREALQLFRASENLGGIASCLFNLGSRSRLDRDLTTAREELTEALHLNRLEGDLERLVVTAAHLGGCHRERGDLERARASMAEACESVGRSTGRVALINLLTEAGHLATSLGDPERGLRYGAAMEAASRAIGLAYTREEQQEFDREMESARAALRGRTGSGEAVERAEADGRALSLDPAIAEVRAWIGSLSESPTV